MTADAPGPLVVVEDGDEDFEVLCLALAQCGFAGPVRRFVDGEAALAFLTAAPESHGEGWPRLVFLDLNLPGMDGREVLQAVRASPRGRLVPIVVLSTSRNPRDVRFCYEAGANCYAIKPVGLSQLEDLVARLVEFWFSMMELPTPG
jgi:CheY-like chemotaxis protein